MQTALFLLLGGGLAGLMLCLLELRRTRQLLRNAHATMIEVDAQDDTDADWPANTARLTSDYEVVIQVNDPIQVAANEAPQSKLVAGIAPKLIAKEVYRQVAKESQTLLAARNIDAQVLTRLRAERRP